MGRRAIVLICLFLSGIAWGADSNIRERAACQSVGPAPPAIHAAVAANPVSHTIYLDSAGGGAFKSTDAAETWFANISGIGDYAIVTALAIDPNTPDTLYAGTYYKPAYKTVTGGR